MFQNIQGRNGTKNKNERLRKSTKNAQYKMIKKYEK